MITFFVRRIFPMLGLASALVLLVRMQHVPTAENDAWMHLRLGEEFRSGWSIAHPGHLGIYDTEAWFPTQWLSQMVMSWTRDRIGIAGVVWLAGTLILALPALMYLVCRRWTAPLPAALAALLATCAAAPGLSARPQVVSYLLILLVTAAWLATIDDLKPRYWLVPLTWVWVPLHGMWLVGITIGLAAVVGIALTAPGLRVVARLAIVPALSAVAALLTPLGINAYSAISNVGDRSTDLTEWMPPDFTAPNAIVLMAMIAIILVVALRGGPVEWPTIAVLGLGVLWALFSIRTTIVAGVMLAPLLGQALQRLVPSAWRMGRRELALVMAMLLLASGSLWFVAAAREDEPPMASWVDARLDAMAPGTRLLNDWDVGPYTMWRHPQLELVMHGYVDVFTVEELRRNIQIARVEPGWDSEVTRLDVDFALVDPESSLGYALLHQPDWTEVDGDDDYVLLKRR